MLYGLGRGLQVAGMLIAPLGMVGNIVDPNAVGTRGSLGCLVVGCAVFGVGWLLQQTGRRS